MSPTDHETTCVLLAPSGKPCDARGELERRGWTSHEVNDPLPAMAELCLLDRTLAVGRPDGSPVVERLAMVVVEPRQWPQPGAAGETCFGWAGARGRRSSFWWP